MPIPSIQKQLAIKQIEKYCNTKLPEHVRNEIALKYELKGNTITLIESRPRWDDASAVWIDMPIAKMKYDVKSMKWQLYCVLGNGKWIVYDDLEPQQDMQECLDEIEEDPTCIFWG
jgi:nicotinamidase-related amidase